MTILVSSILMLLVTIVWIAYDYTERHQSATPSSTALHVPEVNPVTAGKNEIVVPEQPISVAIAGKKDEVAATTAMKEAIIKAGEAVETQCVWNEKKLENGGYDKFVTMNVWILSETVYSQVTVDKSVCPDK